MLIIRPAEVEDAAAIARVHVESWRSTYPGMIPQGYLDRLTVQNRSIGWVRLLERAPPDVITLISEDDDGQVVGFVTGGRLRHHDLRYEAEIASLYVLPGCQRAHHGRRLFLAASHRLAKAGYKGLFIWVLADNTRARKFYEAMDGVAVAEITRPFAGQPLREIGYGWAETPQYG